MLFPALLLTIVAALQVGLYGLSAHALQLAVSEGGARARARPADTSGAVSTVRKDVSLLAGGMVRNVKVRVRGGQGDYVTVAASAYVVSLLPGLQLPIAAASTGPVQLFRASG